MDIAIFPAPRTSASQAPAAAGRYVPPTAPESNGRSLGATFGTIASRMKLNFFAREDAPEPEEPSAPPPIAAADKPPQGKTFPADEVVWGIVIRNGFDELDDPWYHRGTTQHAYLEGNDNVAICGFRPPQSGPRSRRRSRLGLPTGGEHPMCGMCARLVVAPRPRVPIPVAGSRPPVAVPMARPTTPPQGQPIPVALPAAASAAPAAASAAPAAASAAPAAASGSEDTEISGSHDGGLMTRGVHAELDD